MATIQGNRAGRACVVQEKVAALSSEFGMELFKRKFPTTAAQLLEELGTYTRGPRKGLPKGYVHWTKVVEGGWDYEAKRVRYPGSGDYVLRIDRESNSSILAHAE